MRLDMDPKVSTRLLLACAHAIEGARAWIHPNALIEQLRGTFPDLRRDVP